MRRAIATLGGWFFPARFRRTVFVPELYDVPEQLNTDTFYVAGSPRYMKWAVFACPCDRGHHVTLSLQEGDYPRWRLQVDHGRPTVYPSIDVLEEPRCHYWIVRGRVRWAPSPPRS